jgi:hypothetical protein
LWRRVDVGSAICRRTRPTIRRSSWPSRRSKPTCATPLSAHLRHWRMLSRSLCKRSRLLMPGPFSSIAGTDFLPILINGFALSYRLVPGRSTSSLVHTWSGHTIRCRLRPAQRGGDRLFFPRSLPPATMQSHHYAGADDPIIRATILRPQSGVGCMGWLDGTRGKASISDLQSSLGSAVRVRQVPYFVPSQGVRARMPCSRHVVRPLPQARLMLTQVRYGLTNLRIA